MRRLAGQRVRGAGRVLAVPSREPLPAHHGLVDRPEAVWSCSLRGRLPCLQTIGGRGSA